MADQVVNIPLDKLRPFPNHPFEIRDDDATRETVESVKQYGVICPAIVRPLENGDYEIIAGHRRQRACELAGLDTMPSIVRDLDDDAATILMVDSNLQREFILPSERAKAYQMKLEAIKHQGERHDLTFGQFVQKLKKPNSLEEIADETGENAKKVQRFIRLTKHGIVPSFASKQASNAPEVVMHYDSATGMCSATVTDTNGVLADDFDFSASGVTFTKSGNTLTISAPYTAICNGDVIASAPGRALAENNLGAMIWTCPSQQTLIKTVTTSSDPVRAYFKLVPDAVPGTMTLQKTSDGDDVEGYCFKIHEWNTGRTWYGKSAGDGRVYQANAVYVQIGSTKKYTFTDMIDGKYTFLEVLSQKGNGVVFPDSWRITITKQGATVYDHTFTGSDLVKDTNGDCRLSEITLTGLTGGGVMEMTIHNKTLTAPLEIIKRSDDNNVSGISFTVEQELLLSGVRSAGGVCCRRYDAPVPYSVRRGDHSRRLREYAGTAGWIYPDQQSE